MEGIKPVPPYKARFAHKVGQKTVAAPEFRHKWFLGTPRDAVGTTLVMAEVPSAFPPQ